MATITKRNTKLIGLSVDPVDAHDRWAKDIEETQGYLPKYPMIGDTDLAADLTITGRAFPIEEPRFTRRIGPRMMMDLTRMTQNGRWSGTLKMDGETIKIDPKSWSGTRDRSWGVRHVGIRDPQVPVVIREFQAWWVWLPAHLEDRIVHFFVNQDGDGKVWNLGATMVHDEGSRIEHLHGARMDMEYVPGTRYPANAVVTATDEAGGNYRFEITPHARFYLSGIGYMNPEWSHGLNKGLLDLRAGVHHEGAVLRDRLANRATLQDEHLDLLGGGVGELR